MSINGNYPSTTVEQVSQGYGAELAGIQAGDEVLKVDGKKVRIKNDIDNATIKSKDEEIEVLIRKEDASEAKINVKLTTIDENGIERRILGVMFKKAENNFANNIYYGFWDTVNFSVSIVDNLKELFTGGVKADQLMGPVRNIRCCI